MNRENKMDQVIQDKGDGRFRENKIREIEGLWKTKIECMLYYPQRYS